MKSFWFLVLIAFLANSAPAKPVSQSQAQNVAVNLAKAKKQKVSLKAKKPRKSEPNVLYYVFDVGESGGFAIVAGDDVFKPVIGFSESSEFDYANMPPNFAWYLQNIEKEMLFVLENGQEQTPQMAKEWSAAGDAYTPGTYLITTTYKQSSPYNSKTPLVNGTATLTGCVATVMSQIMNYHKYPAKGRGIIPAYVTSTEKLAMPAVNMDTVTFNWSSMNDNAIATLMSVAGKSVEMDYGIEGSGAASKDAAVALRGYFDYDQSIQYIERSAIGDDWENILKEQIDLSLPVYYAGMSGSGSAHAFVLDGYDNTGKFHFNWGWGGQYDGWFISTALEPSTHNYNYSQSAIINIMPNQGTIVPSDYKLRSYGVTSDSIIFQDSALNVSIAINNSGTDDYFGRMLIMLEDELGFEILTEKYVVIPADNSYRSYKFYIPKINSAGGNYEISVLYETDDGYYLLNSKNVSVVGLYMPRLEVNGSVAMLEGYTSVDSISVVLSNIGQKSFANLNIDFKQEFFAKNKNIASIILPGKSDTLKIVPILGLSAGTYRDTLIVTGDNGISLLSPLEIKVMPESEYYSASFDTDSLVFEKKYFSYGIEETKSANFNNAGNLTGLKASFGKGIAFELAGAFPSQLPMSSSTPVSIKAKDGLVPGVYKDTLFITGNNGVSAELPLKVEIAKINIVSEQSDYNMRLIRPITLINKNDTIRDGIIFQDSALTVRFSLQNTGTVDFAGKIVIVIENEIGMERLAEVNYSVPVNTANGYTFGVSISKVKSIGGNYKISALYTENSKDYYMISAVKYTTFDCPNPIDVFVVGLYMPKLEVSGSLAPLLEDYATVDSLNMVFSNIGQKSLSNLKFEFKQGFFASSKNIAGTILPGNSNSFKFAPVLGKKTGIYRDTLAITGDNGVSMLYPLEFEVTTLAVIKQSLMLSEIPQNATVQIYDLKGKLVKGTLPPGIYIVKVKLPGKPLVFFRHVLR
ncbi:MAG: C10 family peptidase [Fibromonadales bacterium]|nr:C10 family peptidase [Fibromonadales bacterium]